MFFPHFTKFHSSVICRFVRVKNSHPKYALNLEVDCGPKRSNASKSGTR